MQLNGDWNPNFFWENLGKLATFSSLPMGFPWVSHGLHSSPRRPPAPPVAAPPALRRRPAPRAPRARRTPRPQRGPGNARRRAMCEPPRPARWRGWKLGYSGDNSGSGWWFGCQEFYFPLNVGVLIIPIDFHIFQRGGPTTNQGLNGDLMGIWWDDNHY